MGIRGREHFHRDRVEGNERFATLADALREANSGDTIEVQGDGPFAVAPARLEEKALVIRAGLGWRPVFDLDPTVAEGAAFLHTRAPLVLEGLTLRWHPRAEGPRGAGVVSVAGSTPRNGISLVWPRS